MVIKFDDIWDNLTIAIPGMVTYGTWRLILLIIGYDKIDFASFDESLLLTASVIVAIAIIQQIFGIIAEMIICGVLYIPWKLDKRKCTCDKVMMIDRFKDRGGRGHKKGVNKRIGQFFLSLNVTIGLIAIFMFIILEINPDPLDFDWYFVIPLMILLKLKNQ